MPSIASKVWYNHSPKAQLAQTQGGQSWSKVGLYHRTVMKLIITKPNPVRVIYHHIIIKSVRRNGQSQTYGIRPETRHLGLATTCSSKENESSKLGYSRHPQREKRKTFVIERFEDKPTYWGVVNPRVFVVPKFRQLMLTNMDHLRLSSGVFFFFSFCFPASLRV